MLNGLSFLSPFSFAEWRPMLRCCAFLLFVCVPFGALAAPVPKEDDVARMLRIYGTVHDPDEGTEFRPSGDTLRLTLPPEKRLLSHTILLTSDRSIQTVNAPRVARHTRRLHRDRSGVVSHSGQNSSEAR
jgi:hypothetical protein